MSKTKHKILIADDEKDILEMLQYNFEKEGFKVVTAMDGQQALDVAEKENPDLIILDIMMPHYDGVEVCERLRELPQFRDTLIIFLTARNEDFTQIACYEIGGDDFIIKPVKPRVLLSRIKALFRRKEKSTRKEVGEIIAIEDLKIDQEKFLVYRKEDKINLAKKEFELLLLLVSKPGKLFTRDEIFSKVWGADQIIGDRTIDVHIRKLREKIGDHYIKTVKGMGYKIELT